MKKMKMPRNKNSRKKITGIPVKHQALTELTKNQNYNLH